MGIKDIFNASKIKEENERMKSLLTPEMEDAVNLQKHIEALQKTSTDLDNSIQNKQTELQNLDEEIK